MTSRGLAFVGCLRPSGGTARASRSEANRSTQLLWLRVLEVEKEWPKFWLVVTTRSTSYKSYTCSFYYSGRVASQWLFASCGQAVRPIPRHWHCAINWPHFAILLQDYIAAPASFEGKLSKLFDIWSTYDRVLQQRFSFSGGRQLWCCCCRAQWGRSSVWNCLSPFVKRGKASGQQEVCESLQDGSSKTNVIQSYRQDQAGHQKQLSLARLCCRVEPWQMLHSRPRSQLGRQK